MDQEILVSKGTLKKKCLRCQTSKGNLLDLFLRSVEFVRAKLTNQYHTDLYVKRHR